jgi:N-methylhydantoinase A
MRAGVDIGGTFTDVVRWHEGRLTLHKRLSTPDDPSRAMLAGLEAIAGHLEALTHVAHGSTVATNAILERKGAKAAMITSQGVRDVLFIGRQERPVLYALHPTLPLPIIERDCCYDVPERLDHRGNVLIPLDMAALDRILDEIARQQVDCVAVCLLYSYLNPDHEEMIRQRIVERGILEVWQVALSCDVLPEFREYERASTTALEAYVRPVMSRYVSRLREALPANGGLSLMQSDGGVMRAEAVRERAVQTALSGPAAGVLGAYHVAKLAGFDQILTLDMGGTSTDVALCAGQLPLSPHAQIDGLPLRIRLLDIETVGAGGGSLVRVDAGGVLRVGPQSAGAMPGPMVYGRGGQQLTVSDANALLGRLDPDHFLGGEMHLSLDPAKIALEILAQRINQSPRAAALGILDVANANIERAVRRVSVARGYDPRLFTLVAFGGAGPLHACAIAERLDIPRVLIPSMPGVLCALGLLVADATVERRLPVLSMANRTILARLRAAQSELLAGGRDALREEGIAENNMRFSISLEMRYAGQAHELTVPFNSDPVSTFHETHRQTYGHAFESRPVEIITMRLQASAQSEKPYLAAQPLGGSDSSTARLKDTVLESERLTVYGRDSLLPGMTFTGAALVVQTDATTYVPVGWQAAVDGYGNLILMPKKQG